MHDEQPDTRIREALARLRAQVDVPPIDPARERALLDAFDAPRPRRRRNVRPWIWAMAAASIAVAVALRPRPGIDMPPVPPRAPEPVTAAPMAGFVPWPGAHALPPLESGEVRRIELPVETLPALGLAPPAAATGLVKADIIVGQDGRTRAVRLVQ